MTEKKTEICVLCGKDTGIPLETPIHARRHFISGCGQLCDKCYGEMEKSNAAEDSFSEQEMNLLLAMSVYLDNGKFE